MTVKELIQKLETFDPDHSIKIEAEYDCGYGSAGNTVDSVEFKNGNCVLISREY
ncbi:hypothetical protein LCGC14_0360440 [marine sediment metagenome]|uniref:Uncharacterized protein n=1 Tax=marine sediment metagenome TaxID=412755 RepID=A0A0F9T8E9_9ZZZZ